MRKKTAASAARPAVSEPGRRKRRTPEEIRKKLLRAARDEFRKKGFTGATIAAIAKRSGVAEIQIFRYYPSKADLFLEAIFTPVKEHFRAFNAKNAPEAKDRRSIREKAQLYTSELLAFIIENAGLMISLFVAQTYATLSKQEAATIRDDLQAFFDECAETMSLRAGYVSDTDPGTVVRIAFGALLGCITY